MMIVLLMFIWLSLTYVAFLIPADVDSSLALGLSDTCVLNRLMTTSTTQPTPCSTPKRRGQQYFGLLLLAETFGWVVTGGPPVLYWIKRQIHSDSDVSDLFYYLLIGVLPWAILMSMRHFFSKT